MCFEGRPASGDRMQTDKCGHYVRIDYELEDGRIVEMCAGCSKILWVELPARTGQAGRPARSSVVTSALRAAS